MARWPSRAAIALVLVALGACGGDGGGAPTTTAAPPGTSTSTSGSDADASTTTTALEGEGVGDVEALAPDLVVTLDELGAAGFDDAGFTPPSGPNVCGRDIDAEVPADVVVGARFAATDGSGVFEEVLRVYSGLGSEVAYTSLLDFFGCGTGTDGITTVEGPTDQGGLIAADGGSASFELHAGDATTTVVIARQADVVLTFTYAGAARPDLDPVTVAAFGVGKVLAALGE